MSEDKPILCGYCRAPIGKRVEPDKDGNNFGCAACNNWTNMNEITRIIGKFAERETARIVDAGLRKAAKNSSVLKVKGKPPAKGIHRFIIDL